MTLITCLDGRSPARILATLTMLLFVIVPPGHSQETVPDTRIEAIVERIHRKFYLTADERLVLGPLVNELALHRRARLILSRQHRAHRLALEDRVRTLRKAWDLIDVFCMEDIEQENTFRLALHKTRTKAAFGLIFDPNAEDKVTNTPPSPPWGNVRMADLPNQETYIKKKNAERLRRFVNSEVSYPFSWPDYGGATRKNIEQAIDYKSSKIEEFNSKDGRARFVSEVPILGRVTFKSVNQAIHYLEQRLTENRDRMRQGAIVLTSEDRPDHIFLVKPVTLGDPGPNGWVTRQQIEDRIAGLERAREQRREARNDDRLVIYREGFGQVTEDQLKKTLTELHDAAKALYQAQESNQAKVYFMGADRWYTRQEILEEMSKHRATVKELRHNEDYRVPVRSFGSLNRAEINAKLKDKNLSKKRRADLQRGLLHIGKAKMLEQTYHNRWLYRLSAMDTLITQRYGAGTSDLTYHAAIGDVPKLRYLGWEFKHCNSVVRHQFDWELGYYQDAYDVQLNHLKQCLTRF